MAEFKLRLVVHTRGAPSHRLDLEFSVATGGVKEFVVGESDLRWFLKPFLGRFPRRLLWCYVKEKRSNDGALIEQATTGLTRFNPFSGEKVTLKECRAALHLLEDLEGPEVAPTERPPAASSVTVSFECAPPPAKEALEKPGQLYSQLVEPVILLGFNSQRVKLSNELSMIVQQQQSQPCLFISALGPNSTVTVNFSGGGNNTDTVERQLKSLAGLPFSFLAMTTVTSQRAKLLEKESLDQQLVDRVFQQCFVPWADPNWKGDRTAGAVFYGPPGTGKTHLIRELLADEHGHVTNGSMSALGFYVISAGSASSVMRPYSGETEAELRRLADEARKRPHQMCVIFWDEFEALGTSRELVTQDYKAGYVAQLLTIIGDKSYPNLFVIACTNHFSKLDPALIRAGRLDRHYLLGPLTSSEAVQVAKTASDPILDGMKFGVKHDMKQHIEAFVQYCGINWTRGQLITVLNRALNRLRLLDNVLADPANVKPSEQVAQATLETLKQLLVDEWKLFLLRPPENLLFNRAIELWDNLKPAASGGLKELDLKANAEWTGRVFVNADIGTASFEGSSEDLWFPPQFLSRFLRHLASQVGPAGKKGATQVFVLDARFFVEHKEEDAFRVIDLLFDECAQLPGRSMIVVDVASLIGWQVSGQTIGTSTSHSYGRSMNVTRSEAYGLTHTKSFSNSVTNTKGSSTGWSKATGTSDGKTEGWSVGVSKTRGRGITIGDNWSRSDAEGGSVSDTYGDSLAISRTLSEGGNSSLASTVGKSDSITNGDQWSRTRGDSSSKTTTNGTSWNTSDGLTKTVNTSFARGRNWNSTDTYGGNSSINANSSESVNDGRSGSNSHTTSFTDTQSGSINVSVASADSASVSDAESKTDTWSKAFGMNYTSNETKTLNVNYSVLRGQMLQALLFYARQSGPALVFVVTDPYLQGLMQSMLNWDSGIAAETLFEPNDVHPLGLEKMIQYLDLSKIEVVDLQNVVDLPKTIIGCMAKHAPLVRYLDLSRDQKDRQNPLVWGEIGKMVRLEEIYGLPASALPLINPLVRLRAINRFVKTTIQDEGALVRYLRAGCSFYGHVKIADSSEGKWVTVYDGKHVEKCGSFWVGPQTTAKELCDSVISRFEAYPLLLPLGLTPGLAGTSVAMAANDKVVQHISCYLHVGWQFLMQ